jgi:hypothetical protein
MFLGIIPYFLQYTDVIPTRRKKGGSESERADGLVEEEVRG